MKAGTRNTVTAVLTAVVFALYIVTDIIEIATGHLARYQVQMTNVVFMLIPFAIMGLYARDRERTGWVYLVGCFFVAMAFIYYSGTDTAALVTGIEDYPELVKKLGFPYIFYSMGYISGAIMMAVVILRNKLHPAPPALLILVGSVVSFFIGAMQFSDNLQILSNMLRNSGFLLIGVSMLKNRSN